MSQEQIDRIMERLDRIDEHLASNCRECNVDLAVGKEKMVQMDHRITEIRIMFWALIVMMLGQMAARFVV